MSRDNIGLTVYCLSGESSYVFEFTFADQEFLFLFTIAIMAPNRDATNLTTTLEYRAIVASWSPEERAAREKTLKRKIDLRLLPILVSNTFFLRSNTLPLSKYYCLRPSEQSLMYILNYIDRNALPQAKVQGISEDIGLAGIEYNIVLSLTFIGYILMQGQPQNINLLDSLYCFDALY